LKKLRDYIEKLSAVPSISGFEDRFSELVISMITNKVDTIGRDTVGNVVATKKRCGSDGLKLLFAAHLDQIGLMITKLEENGILRFTGIGGINPLTLCGKRVRVFGKEEIYGIIGMKPPHITSKEESQRVIPVHELFIDIGCQSGDEASRFVAIGDTVVPDYYSDSLLSDNFSTSGLDNRAGVLTVISFIDLLEPLHNFHEVIFLFTVQEEVGLRGAKVGGFSMEADVAIVCDVTFGDPVGNLTEIATGKGPVIQKGPNYYSPLVKKICDIARREDIPFQEEVEGRPGGTDAYYLQITKRGIYTAGISIPLRYMHSPVEVINLKDVYRASKLMMHLAMEEDLISGS
jgi:putative aminopeptidase FrvX